VDCRGKSVQPELSAPRVNLPTPIKLRPRRLQTANLSFRSRILVLDFAVEAERRGGYAERKRLDGGAEGDSLGGGGGGGG
jgi:hypothetical protein